MAALTLFAVQVAAAVVSVQIVFYVMLGVVPLHAAAVDRFGAQAAACLLTLAATVFAHLAGVAMTVPALTGVKVWKIQVKKVATVEQLLRDVPTILLNFVLSVLAGSASMLLTARSDILHDIAIGLPSPYVLAAQTAFSLLMTEVWFYHVHRLFHENKWLYAKVHKQHHTWTAPVALVSTYANPIEHVGNNLISLFWGPYLCGAHPLTTLAYTLVFAVGAYGHHSGYWSDDLGMHDLHHETFNVNYGNAHVLDYFYGTYRLKESEGAAAKSQ